MHRPHVPVCSLGRGPLTPVSWCLGVLLLACRPIRAAGGGMSARAEGARQLVGVVMPGRPMGRWLLGVLVGLGVVGGAVAPARATVPGLNGKIALSRGDIWTINSDGSQPTNITNEYSPSGPGGPGAYFCGASWSPNGTQIAYLKFPN